MDNKINVLVIGDSIVYGMGDTEKGGWVNRLRLKLEKDTTHFYDVYNLGIPDDNSEDVFERYGDEILHRYYDGELIVIYAFGGNDCIQTSTDLEVFKMQLRLILRPTKLLTKHIKYVGITKMNKIEGVGRHDKLLYSKNLEKLNEYNDAIKEVCKEEDIQFIDVFDKNISISEDGIHPDCEGHELISEVVYNILSKEIQQDEDYKISN